MKPGPEEDWTGVDLGSEVLIVTVDEWDDVWFEVVVHELIVRIPTSVALEDARDGQSSAEKAGFLCNEQEPDSSKA